MNAAPDEPRDEDFIEEEEAEAAKEAAGIGGNVPPDTDDPAEQPLIEGGEGESEGFELAEADLELRREGNVLGTTQAGRSTALKQLSLLRDKHVIEQAREDAIGLVGDDPEMSAWPGLAEMVSLVIASESQEYLDKG